MFYRKIIYYLEQWKKSETRKPLIIRGARQVGKTTVVNEFSKQFKQYIYINLENHIYKSLFENYTDIHKITEQLFFLHDKELKYKSDTLLFIDEIQEVPTAINYLRYFKEEIPELPVIAAGSMLETLLGKNINFPVGRVEYVVLRPVSFEEFLGAIEEKNALEQLTKVPLKDFAYSKLLNLFHTYALIGGMPEIVDHYAKNRDITALKPIYQSLINSYLEDAEKYAKNSAQLQLIRFTIQQVMHQAGKRITFQGFGNSNYKSKEIGETLRTLQKTHLLNLIYPTTNYSLPLIEDFKKAPRLQFLDSGLMNYHVGLQKEIIGTKDLNSVYQGTLIEHLVGQEIISYQHFPLDKLNYWVREKNSSQAELDYVIPYEGKVIPVEVKSGSAGKIKSLSLFINEATIHYGIRFYAGELTVNTLKTADDKTFYLLNLPYFLAGQIEKYIEWFEKSFPKPYNNVLNEPITVYAKPKKTTPFISTVDGLSSSHKSILKYCLDGPKKGKEIIEEHLGLTYQSRNKKQFLKPLLELNLLEWTIPENPKSKQQAYRITAKGKAV
jgi:predicted AAA+ superfamily ATPase